MPKQLDVIYEDETCLIINKPAGMAVQGGAGVSVSLDTILADLYTPRPLLVHRLDRDTSGVILVAKNKAAAALYSRLIEEGRFVHKQYLAVCAGTQKEKSGHISMDIEVQGKIKHSLSAFTVLQSARSASPPEKSGMEFSLMELEPETGRMHQLRRHMAAVGTPILGDDKYGDFTLNKLLKKTMKLKHMLLHARRLAVLPGHGVLPIDVSAPLPDYFQHFLEQVDCSLFLITPPKQLT